MAEEFKILDVDEVLSLPSSKFEGWLAYFKERKKEMDEEQDKNKKQKQAEQDARQYGRG